MVQDESDGKRLTVADVSGAGNMRLVPFTCDAGDAASDAGARHRMERLLRHELRHRLNMWQLTVGAEEVSKKNQRHKQKTPEKRNGNETDDDHLETETLQIEAGRRMRP